MDPYRTPARAAPQAGAERDLEARPTALTVAIARSSVLAWALLRGAVAAARAEWSADLYLVIAVVLVLAPGISRSSMTARRARETGL